ncbi:PEP/pyruvate-binding domain-containing protein [Brevibacillus sp. B_LB10_24]|uniref:PEP/pyruvate-binding domain-containing protein n=1 Tax=Brevibacillus sp. B_LB10_24 TaxID=3380645 RepID=UPI0038B7F6EF
MYTVPLKQAGQSAIQLVGSKAWHLGRLMQAGIRIPDGFVITSQALERFRQGQDLAWITREDEIGQEILQAAMPADVAVEIAAAYQSLQTSASQRPIPVAVRSSSSAEDLPESSFAGQYDTILNVRGTAQLEESIKRCWSSLFSPQVIQYVQHQNIFTEVPSMAVLVQQMIPADVSGVIFSMNPLNRDREQIVINASYGLGEAVVSGLVTPDTFYVNKWDLHLRKELGQKEMKIVSRCQGTEEVETSVAEQSRYCLFDADILALAKLAKKLEAFCQYPVDIEFAVKDQWIYILQARPITT